jgi:hypothetical protein
MAPKCGGEEEADLSCTRRNETSQHRQAIRIGGMMFG